MNCNTIEQLPTEIIKKILSALSLEDLRSAKLCCKRWSAVLNDNFLWKKLCQRECYVEMEEWSKSEFYTSFLQRYNNYWEGVYWYNHTVQQNWETKTCNKFTYKIKGPQYDYAHWTFLDDLFIIMNLLQTEMYIYNLRGTKLVTCSTDAHNFNIARFSKMGNYLFEFVPYLKLTVWELKNGSIIYHDLLPNVARMYPYYNLIVLHTPNEMLAVFNIETNRIEYERIGIFSNVNIMDGRIVFTMDNVIHILNWDDKSLVTLTCCNKNRYQLLLVASNLLLSFCKMENPLVITLCFWNIATKTKLRSVSLGNALNLSNVAFINKYLYVAKKLRTVNDFQGNVYSADFWDYKKKTLALTLTNITAPNATANQNFIIASVSFKVVMFCFRTGQCIEDLRLPFPHYQLGNILMTDSKLAYIKCKKHYVLLHVKDFEV